MQRAIGVASLFSLFSISLCGGEPSPYPELPDPIAGLIERGQARRGGVWSWGQTTRSVATSHEADHQPCGQMLSGQAIPARLPNPPSVLPTHSVRQMRPDTTPKPP